MKRTILFLLLATVLVGIPKAKAQDVASTRWN